MEQELISSKKARKLEQIEFVKKLVTDLYRSRVFYSFSLYTLELSRRFNSTYQSYRKTKSPQELEKLQELAEKLEEKLLVEGEL